MDDAVGGGVVDAGDVDGHALGGGLSVRVFVEANRAAFYGGELELVGEVGKEDRCREHVVGEDLGQEGWVGQELGLEVCWEVGEGLVVGGEQGEGAWGCQDVCQVCQIEQIRQLSEAKGQAQAGDVFCRG